MSERIVRGVRVPSFMYGTAWKEERTAPLVRQALDAGFRAIDTANQRKHYFEAAVGEAIETFSRERSIARGELFVQTKFTHQDGQDSRLPYDPRAPIAEQVAQSFRSSLEHLRTEYVDSLVLHGPSLAHGLADEDWEAWRAILALVKSGGARLAGVSNVSAAQLDEICRAGDAPAFVQNRCYARRGWDRDVRAICRAHDVVYQGFSLLTANQRELSSTAVRQIAAHRNRTPAQVVFRFALQVGMLPLTGTSDARHLREDLAALDFALDDGEVAAIERVSG